MIDGAVLVEDAKRLTSQLIDDLRARTENDEPSREQVRGMHSRAVAADRTDKSFEEWREDLLAQVAAGWVLASVFVRFCEDNGLVDDPLLSGPGSRMELARDHRAAFFAEDPTAGDREWLEQVFRRYQEIPAVAEIFGDRNPLWQLTPSADGARAILDLWWKQDDEGRAIRYDFTDEELDTRFLGDLYQDLSEHARKQYALLQTPQFVESFILDRTLDPAIETFGLDDVRMIDPTCGSGHFLLEAFDRLLERWRQREPGTEVRALAQRALDAVHGVDVNPFAVAIARFRLLVAALRASSLRRLQDMPAFRLKLAVGDSLLHGIRKGGMFSARHELNATVLHHYATEDADEVERILQVDGYHAVVGNPPYITVKDGALNQAYRGLYETCHRQYSLAVPFKERFFQLAVHGNASQQAGYVGMITANSFMKREFGSKLIEQFLPHVDLTHVIDTSGAYIPGHGTPTVILLGRDQEPSSDTVRAVLGIRGEPGRPADPAEGLVWASIRDLVDKPGAENDYISVDDVDRDRFQSHPWSLQGGAAPAVKQALERSSLVLDDVVSLIGYTGQTNADPVFLAGRGDHQRFGVEPDIVRRFVTGTPVRDYIIGPGDEMILPYSIDRRKLVAIATFPGMSRRMWRARTVLGDRQTFAKKSYIEDGRTWWEWHQVALDRVPGLCLTYAFVATHNHFVLDRGGKVFNRHAPVIKLPEGAAEREYLELLGLLNSSTACFWMKQVFHNKGSTVDKAGARQTTVPFEDFWEFDSTKLKQFPLPNGRPLRWAQALDDTAHQLAEVLPSAVAEREAPTRDVLDTAREKAETRRAWMVALQEELDWRCYRLYGLIDQDLTFDLAELPALQLAERAFEIALARRVAADEATTTWFERHGSTPITELPAHWPAGYRDLVERRLVLIESDRGIRLLERPEYKRRWNWDAIADLEAEAQRTWLLGRIEDLLRADGDQPAVTTCARLADRLAQNADAVAVAHDYSGAGADLVALVTQLVESAGVPFLAAWRLEDSGLRTRAVWERTWELQRRQDAIDERLGFVDGETDPESALGKEREREREREGVHDIPVPPKYKKADFRSDTTYKLRGKLDVPKERFILYPATRSGADATPVVGWAGWDHLGQARALAGHLLAREDDGAEVDELVPLLAGVDELVPWLLQWHDEPDPVYGERMGQYFDAFVTSKAPALGVTRDDLHAWRPPTSTRGRRRKATTRP